MCNVPEQDIRIAVFHLRLSPRIDDQHTADRIAKWLDSDVANHQVSDGVQGIIRCLMGGFWFDDREIIMDWLDRLEVNDD